MITYQTVGTITDTETKETRALEAWAVPEGLTPDQFEAFMDLVLPLND
jgi:hypothetical protein